MAESSRLPSGRKGDKEDGEGSSQLTLLVLPGWGWARPLFGQRAQTLPCKKVCATNGPITTTVLKIEAALPHHGNRGSVGNREHKWSKPFCEAAGASKGLGEYLWFLSFGGFTCPSPLPTGETKSSKPRSNRGKSVTSRTRNSVAEPWLLNWCWNNVSHGKSTEWRVRVFLLCDLAGNTHLFGPWLHYL